MSMTSICFSSTHFAPASPKRRSDSGPWRRGDRYKGPNWRTPALLLAIGVAAIVLSLELRPNASMDAAGPPSFDYAPGF